MADITLHSGSFCDRNNDEIIITFFKRSSTPVMTVDPTALSFTSNGGTKTLRVSNYTGTLSISVSGGTGWLGYTQSTSSGVRTYTFTATANNTTSLRNAVITLTDNNNTVTVGVSQAGATSFVEVNPNYLVFNSNGETKTTTVTWSGGSTPTWSNAPEWASITSSVSGGTMTLTINVGPNTDGYQRTGTVYVSNGISRADLALEQSSTHSVSVQPSSFTFPESGGTQVLTISDIQGSFSMNYEGIGLSVTLLDYPSSTSRRYNVTYSANPSSTARDGTISVKDTAGVWVRIPTTQAGSTAVFAVSPTSFEYGGTGSTNTFTLTGIPAAGIGYEIPSGVDWVTVSTQSVPFGYVDITTSANQSPNSRTTTVKLYDLADITNYVTVTVNQEAGQSSLSVSPTSITYLPEGGTYGVTATWTAGTEPTTTIRYVQGDGGWMSSAGSGTVTGNTKEWAWTASANTTGSSRTAVITVTNGLQSEYVSVSQSSESSPTLTVTPSSIDFDPAGESYLITAAWNNGGGYPSHQLEYLQGEDGWLTLTPGGTTGYVSYGYKEYTLVAAANNTGSTRTAVLKISNGKFYGENARTVTISQSSTQAVPTLSVSPMSITYLPAGGTYGITATWTVVEPTATLTYVDGAAGWLTQIGNGTVTGNTKEWAWTASANNTGSSRTARVDVTNGTDSYAVAISQASGSTALEVTPSSLSFVSGGETKTATVSNISGTLTYTNPSWITISESGSGTSRTLNVTAARNWTYLEKSGSINVDDNRQTPVTIAVQQEAGSEPIEVSPSHLDFPYTYGSYLTVNIGHITPYGYSYERADEWIHGSKGQNSLTLTATSNTSTSPRTTSVDIYVTGDSSNRATVTVSQDGVPAPTPSIAVSPSSLDFSYTSGSDTLTVSGVSSYNTSLSYNTGVSGWLSVLSNANTITVSASGTTYPSSRTATLTVTNASDATDSVAIPISQAGNPQVLSVTPNAWNYPSSLSYHEFTVTYVSTGDVDYTVAYDRQPGEEEIDWLAVELVDHEEGTETWTFSIDVGPNNTGSGRAAMVTFEGDGGGVDEVSVYQQP